GRSTRADRLSTALAAGRSGARTVPAARLSLATQPCVCRPPGQERLSLLPLRCGWQCSGLVGGRNQTASLRSGTGSVPTLGPARSLVDHSTSRETQKMTALIHTILEGDHDMPAP